MKQLWNLCLLIGVISFLGSASPAHAYLTFFGEDLNSSDDVPLGAFPNAIAAEAAFLAALVDSGTEDFEGFADGTPAPLNLNFPGIGTATLQGGEGEINAVAAGTTNGEGRYGTSPENYWQVAAGDEGDFEILFGEETAAFGFFGVDVGDFGGDLELLGRLVGGGTELFDVDNTIGESASTSGSVLFFGVIAELGDSLFESVAFLTESGDDDIFAFDDFTIGVRERPDPPSEIPEPGTALLLGLGLAGLGARRHRLPR